MPRLLVTNCDNDPASGGVYLLDTGPGTVQRLHDQSSRGITRGPDGYYVVGNLGEVHRLDPARGSSDRVAATGYRASHDLVWTGQEFYLVGTQGNWVVRYDSALRRQDAFQVVEDERDICHANCLAERDGELLLSIFSFAGMGESKAEIRARRTEGKVLRLHWDARRCETAVDRLSQPHSLVWHEGQLYCCESFKSQVARLDPERGGKTTLCRLSAFVRGLAFSGGRAYVGISRRRRLTPLQRLFQPFHLKCGVVEMETGARRWRRLRHFPLPGTQVYAILPFED